MCCWLLGFLAHKHLWRMHRIPDTIGSVQKHSAMGFRPMASNGYKVQSPNYTPWPSNSAREKNYMLGEYILHCDIPVCSVM